MSPFNWYLGGEPLKNGLQWGHAGLLLGLAVLFIAAGTWRYNRRDIAVGSRSGDITINPSTRPRIA